jgi:hypothetical protein
MLLMQTAMRWKYHTDFTVCSDQARILALVKDNL